MSTSKYVYLCEDEKPTDDSVTEDAAATVEPFSATLRDKVPGNDIVMHIFVIKYVLVVP